VRFALLAACAALVFSGCSSAGGVRSAEVDGIPVAYTEEGRGGTPLILIHGWTCDRAFWRGNFPELAKTRRVIALDLPGHGESGKPETTYSLELFARAVHAVMEKAGVERGVLAGHSMGTAVMIAFHGLYPDRVAGLVVVDGFIPMKPTPPEAREKFLDGFRNRYEATTSAMIGAMLPETMTAETREFIRSRMSSTPQHVGRSAMEEMTRIDPTALRPIGSPALAVMVRRPNDAEYRQFLLGIFRQLTYESWEDAGHFLMMEHPGRFNARLNEFLAASGL
jgi:pimeloyl-ACP methyl ester carboxylesterase